ncbi:MAG: CRISPR-associated protein Csx11 [Bacteroidetes bacterium]|nr:MAG: CRISPR-associated protein Csx11 [Bacteroidota bacterium]
MSSTFSPAETLRRHRPVLLAMEAIGWLHMAGKARAEFLRHHGGENNGYQERQWHQQETPPFPWDGLLEWVRRLYGATIPGNAWPNTFAAFTEQHAGRNPGLLGLLQAGHGIVSGVEKNHPTSTTKYLNQSIPDMWLSSPWGHPKRNLLADPPEILSPQGWRQLVDEMRRVLEELRDLGAQGVQDVALWRRWRESAIGGEAFIRRAFLSTLAETRLPNNDVTLWDQSYVAAALFKSAVAGALLTTTNPNASYPWTEQDIQQIAQSLGVNLSSLPSRDREAYVNGFIKNKTRWRLLTVAIGTEHYEARSVKIGDWTGAQGAIEEFFRRVAELVEVDLAAGSLLYRDGRVAVFSFPGERFDETVQAGWLNGWKRWLQEQVEEIARDLDLETPPHVRLSCPTRSLVPMVRERREAQKSVAIPVHKPWNIRLLTPSEARGHACPVCGVRLNGDPTNKGKPCAVCRERRHHRRDAWLQGQLGNDTIWFEEVADRNGRLALLTFSLDLEDWLNGERVDSLRAQAIPEWVRFNPVLNGTPNPIDPHRAFDSLRAYVRSQLGSFNSSDPVLKNLQEGYRHESDWPTFFEKIVEDRADAPSWGNLNDDQRAAWLAHQLFRKLPSPGRVYRFWREAEDFFHYLLREFLQLAARSDNSWRVRRLVLVPDNHGGWRDLTLYDSRWQGRQMSLIYVRSLGGFVTASNLARLLQPEEVPNSFQGAQIGLEDEDAPGRRRDMTVGKVRELKQPHAHLGIYHPVIPVEISPMRFRVMVPLEVASECLDLALTWWRAHFARVWDRLPLRMGVVGFPRMVPYQAVVEAARNVEDALLGHEETWQVQEVDRRAGVVALRLRRPDGRETLRVVPVTLPDGREDLFYPYVAVQDRQVRFPRDFQHPDGQVFRHVADLRLGDGIAVRPSRVKTLFMDSTAVRFDAALPQYLDEWGYMREVWSLLQRVAPSQTALQRLRGELARLEKDWQTPPEGQSAATSDLWQGTLSSVLAHHLGVQGTTLETLTEAGVKGILQWALNWHLTVLKESV